MPCAMMLELARALDEELKAQKVTPTLKSIKEAPKGNSGNWGTWQHDERNGP